MKRVLLIAVLFGFAAPAMAQQMSPMQQYLYDESGGYAPGYVAQPQQQVQQAPVQQQPQQQQQFVAAPPQGYAVAQGSDGSYYYVPTQPQQYDGGNQFNHSLTGMNNY